MDGDKITTIPTETLAVLVHLAENEWERVKHTKDGESRRMTIKQALADGHRALQFPLG